MTVTAAPAQGRVMEVADLLRLQTLIDVEVAPAGDLCALVVQTMDQEADASYSSIWIVDLLTRRTWALSSGPFRDSAPKWRPGSRTLAFLSDRPTSPDTAISGRNVFSVDFDHPGEPQPLTRLQGGFSDYSWAPAGDRICIVRTDANPDPHDSTDAHVYDRLPFWDPLEGWLKPTHAHLWLLDLANEELRQLTFGDCNDSSPIWSPDGVQIAFVSDRHPQRELLRTQGIWLVAADGSSEPEQISDPDSVSESPAFSPDGQEIAYFSFPHPSTGADRIPHLFVRPITRATAERRLDDWDRAAGNHLLTETRKHAGSPPPVWSDDGTRLLFVATDRACAHLVEVSRGGGTPKTLTPGDLEVVAFAPISSTCEAFAVVIGTASRPGALYRCVPEGEPDLLADLNAELMSELRLTELERFEFAGADGWELEGWLLKPPDFDPSQKHPLILRIAGGPGQTYGHSFVEDVHLLAGRGNAIAFINPRGTVSYGERFAAAIRGDWLGKDYEDQMLAIDHLLAENEWIDESRLGVTGASYGGLMVNWIVTQTNRFAAAVSQRSISNFISVFGVGPYIANAFIPAFNDRNPYDDPEAFLERSPLLHVQKVETPLLLIQAGEDYITPMWQAQEFFVALRFFGKRARLVVYPHEQHYIRRYGRPSSRVHYLTMIADWFSEYMPANNHRG